VTKSNQNQIKKFLKKKLGTHFFFLSSQTKFCTSEVEVRVITTVAMCRIPECEWRVIATAAMSITTLAKIEITALAASL